MVLAFCGISRSQAEIAAQIEYVQGVGTPSRKITRLTVFGVEVEWKEAGKVDDLQQAIADGKAPVVFVRTGELPYWDQDTPHALVVVGIEANTVYVNDPAFKSAPILTPVGDFELAWEEFGRHWAIVRRSSQDR